MNNNLGMICVLICCPIGIFLGYVGVVGRVDNLKDTLEIETIMAIVVTVGINWACGRDHILGIEYLPFMFVVLMLSAITFNLGGLLALVITQERKKKGEGS